jgi:hypothetical protein
MDSNQPLDSSPDERQIHNQQQIFRGSYFNCLAQGHTKKSCMSQVRRRACYKYGHVSRDCFAKRRTRVYRHKTNFPSSSESSHLKAKATAAHASTPDHCSTSSPQPALSPSMAAEHEATLAAMANNSVDPDPLLPHGFTICNCSQEEVTPSGFSPSAEHQSIISMRTSPSLYPVDYPHVSNAIYGFLVNSLHLRGVSILRSGLGAVLVSFASSLDCQFAMGGPQRMEPYWLSFVPHDAGSNLRHLALDRTCWLMLVNFPIDCHNEQSLASAVSSFANLIQWHQSSNLARQIVLVNLHPSARIPYSIVVSIGDEPFARCLSVTVFLLTESQM